MDKEIGIFIYGKDASLMNLLQEYLQMQGYRVELGLDKTVASDVCIEKDCSLCILDVDPDDPEEWNICQSVKINKENTAVIFMTSKPPVASVIAMYQAGADDLVRKPLVLEELLARIRAILWRTKGEKAKQVVYYRLGKYLFDTRKQVLAVGEEVTHLTTKECALLTVLCEHANKVVDRPFVLRAVWKNDSYFSARSMDVYITKLRKLLKKDTDLSIINIHGHGYKLVTSRKEM